MNDSIHDTMNNVEVTGFVAVTTPDLHAIAGGCMWCTLAEWFGCGGCKKAPTQPPKPPTKESQLPVFQWQG